jgi:phospholipid-binding lipoprotein MlaA
VRGPFKHPAYSIGASVVRSLDYRVEFDDTLRKLNIEAKDPYAATRTYYLAMRQAEIDALHGKITPVPDPSSFAPKTPAVPAPAPARQHRKQARRPPLPRWCQCRRRLPPPRQPRPRSRKAVQAKARVALSRL